MKAALLALSGLLSAVPAFAEFGPKDVWTGDAYACSSHMYENGPPAWFQCLYSQGVPNQAATFAQLANANPLVGDYAILSAFQELGAVDVGTIELPFRANTNSQSIFLNTDLGMTPSGHLRPETAPSDAGTQQVLHRFPQAFPSGRHAIVAHRVLPNGWQRFVVTDILTNRCRACEIAGTEIYFVDFAGNRSAQVTAVGWVLPEGPDTSESAASAILQGDVRELQRQLNLGGYLARGMDGVVGQQTMTALAEFRAEHCLGGSQWPDAREVGLLVAANGDGRRPTCNASPSGNAGRLAMIASGTYAEDPRLCDPNNRIFQLVPMQFAWPMVISPTRIESGGHECSVRRIERSVNKLSIAGSCISDGGSPYETTMDWTILSPTAFRWGEMLWSRCRGN